MGGDALEAERVLTPCESRPEIFFPEGYLGKPGPEPDYHNEASMAARALCAGCPLRETCLDGAVSRQEPYGIWGGLDPDQLIIEGIKRNAMLDRGVSE